MENTIGVVTPKSDFTFADQFSVIDGENSEFYGLLLRGMTHKLNNLLAVIQGFSSLIMMDEALDETVMENISHMKEAANNASDLSERILPAGGCSQITQQELLLAEFLPMLEDNLKEPFNNQDIPISIQCPGQVTKVNADPSRLKNILSELMANAADAASEGNGKASMEIHNPGDFSPIEENCVDILVKNSGTTIPNDKLEQIWQPFYSSKDSSHFGIGLTTATVLSRQMGMNLGVHSADNTTVFWLSIPAA
ncbi:MAG: HAMP domain-containing sensor histidine kinase [Verrucomicrobiota bacterium]|nr:HAMP domain-containing sensor histidine kinase [Verrucomicrobiota bacterium]